MPYKSKIKQLEESYKLIDSQISNFNKTNNPETNLQKLKEKRQEYLNELNVLRKLQWEEEHDRVSFDDYDR